MSVMKKSPYLLRRLLLLSTDEGNCTDTAFFWNALDQNENSAISWEELKSACTSSTSSDEDEDTFRVSIDTFCQDNHQQRNEPNITYYLECSNSRISLEDRLVAQAFCDVLVEHRCSLLVTNEEGNETALALTIATGSLFVFVAIIILGLRQFVRAKPGRRRAATNDDNDESPAPSRNAERTSEVNDFVPPQYDDDEWSSIGSGSSITDGSSCVTGQGRIVRTVAQGRIVLDDADQDVVSLKKEALSSAQQALALQGTESTMYDFDSIEQDVEACTAESSNNNITNASLYFDCIPFPSSSTAL